LTLENELQEALNQIAVLKQDKQTMQTSIEELQSKLTQAETANAANASSSVDNMTMEALLKKGKREKLLESHLVKAKKDKDKAVKIIIQLIGKGKINDFMSNKSKDGTDALDEIAELFGLNDTYATKDSSSKK
jgi:hypothetical protein